MDLEGDLNQLRRGLGTDRRTKFFRNLAEGVIQID